MEYDLETLLYIWQNKPRRYLINLRGCSREEKEWLKREVIRLSREGKSAKEIAAVYPMNIVTIQEWIHKAPPSLKMWKKRGRKPLRVINPTNHKRILKDVFLEIYNKQEEDVIFWSYSDIQRLVNEHISGHLEEYKKKKRISTLDRKFRYMPVAKELSRYHVKKVVSELLEPPSLAKIRHVFAQEYREPGGERIRYEPNSSIRWCYITGTYFRYFYERPNSRRGSNLNFWTIYSPRGDMRLASKKHSCDHILQALLSRGKNWIALINGTYIGPEVIAKYARTGKIYFLKPYRPK
ncbi:hypothetical protein STSP2_03276 [Anaerohalosphaera lusitana]|uniref:Uncharacterized protein n=1 Tax=Anaerohalosphaera lusitana TaxID=1936003 RepID=A0A1U9NQR2_9BACT|nr:hypothetical protein [Anaerohalosphaera lusitana]AQT70074.1 hypothetical protein STSP2_03276 [Anaerohalosphaera lusitana]